MDLKTLPQKPIETERLYLRQWTAEDRAPFAELNADPQVMRYFPACFSRAESDAMADKCARLIDDRGWGFWAVERKADGRFMGFVGLHTPFVELPFNPCVEIGWRLGKTFWGQGYATEAAKASLRIGFEALELPEIVSFTAVINRPSRAVMERLGMVPATATFGHPSVPEDHVLREHCLYRLTRQQWKQGEYAVRPQDLV